MGRRSCRYGLIAAMFAPGALLAPAGPGAAAPVCSPATGLVANVQAGPSIPFPAPPCSDSAGAPVSIALTQAPVHGTLSPSTTQPIGTTRTYTADAGAGGLTDVIKFK